MTNHPSRPGGRDEKAGVVRYAIYFAPEPDEPLARFGAAWLGRDAEAGRPAGPPPATGIDPGTRHAITAEPRRYGFHATLKPPFALAAGHTEMGLLDAVAHLAEAQSALVLPPLRLAAIAGFLALVPSVPCAKIGALARACVEELDGFRRQPKEAELARRRSAPLSPRQDELLLRWGYPYGLDEYRFHMTLTGTLDAAERERIIPILEASTAMLTHDPVPVSSIAVFAEPAPSADFIILKRFPLRPSR